MQEFFLIMPMLFLCSIIVYYDVISTARHRILIGLCLYFVTSVLVHVTLLP